MKKMLRGLLAGFLSVSLIGAFGGSPVSEVHAEEGDAEGIVANKTAKVNEDGSYTISLDAYVKGEIITTTTPVDVVMVVDVSNSMGWAMENFDLYPNPTEWQKCAKNGQTSKMKNAMNAADAFADILLGDNAGKEEALKNSLTFVTFAGYDKESSDPTWGAGNMDSVQVIFDSEKSATTAKSYFDKVEITSVQNGTNGATYTLQLPQAGNPNRTVSGTNLGGTNYDYAFYEANLAIDTVQGKYQNYSNTGRKTFVVFMTDGAPDQYNDYCYRESSAYDHVYLPHTTTKYNHDPANQNQADWLSYLNATPNGYAWNVYNRVDGQFFTVGFDLNHGGFSGNQWTQEQLKPFLEGMVGHGKTVEVQLTTNAEDLENIFKGLANKAKAASMELGSQAVMRDIVSKSFTLPPGADANDITVQVVPYDTVNNRWNEANPYEINSTTGRTAWERDNNENIVVNIDGEKVNVTGFDYSKHCFAENADDPSLNADAAKLVVSFVIYAKPEAITGSSEQTNDPGSGIYDEKGNCVLHFPRPDVQYGSKTFVLDYAKKTTLDYSQILTSVARIDDPSDNVLRGDKVSAQGVTEPDHFEFKEYETKYGFVKYINIHTGNVQDPTKFLVEYTPRTMKWDGYDKLFIMGKPTTDYTPSDPNSIYQGNVWGLMTVIPANNVYFEDTFVKSADYSEDAEGNEHGTVGITYTGFSADGTEKANIEEHANGAVAGWEETLKQDAEYSGESAHKASNGTGTAEFSFTGTGVDIYSRTNNSTGTILVTLRGAKAGENGKTVSKIAVISNKAKQGDYYQIPTCTFTDLEYNTYNVKITVTNTDTERLEYYLDGIRVYNPIQPKESDDLVKEAYKNELGAVFTEMKTWIGGDKLAYIDEDASGGETAVGNYGDTEEGKLAPEHEIYVGAGKSVVIEPQKTGNFYYIGMKAPKGSTTVLYTAGDGAGDGQSTTQQIKHSTDLYYRVIPNNGTITITNTGSNLLALTKIRITKSGNKGIDPKEVSFNAVSPDKAIQAVRELKAATVIDYNEVLTAEEAEITEPEEPVVTPEPTDPEVEIIDVPGDDITIVNPDPYAEPDNGGKEKSGLGIKWFSKLFSTFLKLFS